MFRNFRVGKKLAIGFGAVIVVIVGTAVTLYVQTRSLYDIERLNSLSDTAIDGIDKIKGDLISAQSAARKLVMTGAERDHDGFDDAVAAHVADLSAVRTILAKNAPDLLPQLETYEKTAAIYTNSYLGQQVRLASSAATRAQAMDLQTSDASKPARMAASNDLAKMRADVSRWADYWSAAGDTAIDRMMLVVTSSGLVSTLLAAVMSWLIGRAIATPIGAMTGTMQALARGDHTVAIPAVGQRDEIGDMAAALQVFKAAAIEKLRLEADAVAAGRLTEHERAHNTAALAEAAAQQSRVVETLASGLSRLSNGDLVHRIDERFPDTYEKLRADFNSAMGKLHDTMSHVATSASTIRSGTGEISSASDDLSRRTEQQAASLEETATALDEITATVRKTAEGSKHARTVVGSARGSAEQSGRVVSQAVEAMSGIERSSHEIGQIIGVIDEIAFQTNLLARPPRRSRR